MSDMLDMLDLHNFLTIDQIIRLELVKARLNGGSLLEINQRDRKQAIEELVEFVKQGMKNRGAT